MSMLKFLVIINGNVTVIYPYHTYKEDLRLMNFIIVGLYNVSS